MASVSKQRPLVGDEVDKAASCALQAFQAANGTIARRGLYGDVAEDVYDKAVDGLLHAATVHDPARGKMTTMTGLALRSYIGHAFAKAAMPRPAREPFHDRELADRRDPAGDVERRLDAADRLADVRHAMELCLTPRQREAVSLYYGLDGGPPLSPAEIGERLGMSDNLVHYHVKAAVRRLRMWYGLKDEPKPAPRAPRPPRGPGYFIARRHARDAAG